MKSFRTGLVLPADPFLEWDQPILTLGSCFAEHMGQKLLDCKWQGLNAPFGTLFHPLALAKLLHLALRDDDLDEGLFFEHDGAFFHHDLHSRFYGASRAAVQLQWHGLAAKVRSVLQQRPCVLLTLGTAWVYAWSVTGQLVANCHKRPANEFQKRLLSADDIAAALDEILSLVPGSAPLVISLSPVRHIRDTMILNSLSKSLLLVQIHAFAARHPDRVRYFPAYEIMLDDLRDYRFYEPDMLHPSGEAIAYIWETFIGSYATDATRKFLRRWQPVLDTLRHRPQRPEAPSYQRHLREVLQELDSLPGIDASAEKAELRSRLLP